MTQHQHPGHVDPILAAGDEPLSNPSTNDYFGDFLDMRISPRTMLRGSLAAAVTSAIPRSATLVITREDGGIIGA